MDKKKLLDIGSTIVLLIGMFYAFLPHAFHAKAGLVEDSHMKHVITGFALIVASLGVLIYNNNALDMKKFKFKRQNQ